MWETIKKYWQIIGGAILAIFGGIIFVLAQIKKPNKTGKVLDDFVDKTNKNQVDYVEKQRELKAEENKTQNKIEKEREDRLKEAVSKISEINKNETIDDVVNSLNKHTGSKK